MVQPGIPAWKIMRWVERPVVRAACGTPCSDVSRHHGRYEFPGDFHEIPVSPAACHNFKTAVYFYISGVVLSRENRDAFPSPCDTGSRANFRLQDLLTRIMTVAIIRTRKKSCKMLQFHISFLSMEAAKDEAKQTIEPQFLAKAQADGVKLHVGQMNKTDHEGIIREIGRYEINLDVNGRITTLLKQEITHLTAPHPILASPPAPETREAAKQVPSAQVQTRPNVQQEFLDKAIKENQPLTLFLINGNRIKANIEAYDNFTILLKEGGRQHLYYKHAITTINR